MNCQHRSVPWPVMAGGDLVAWLCEECMEPRPTFRCPPPKVICSHEDTEEIRTLDNGIVRLYCVRCGRTEMRVEEFVDFPMATFRTVDSRPEVWP